MQAFGKGFSVYYLIVTCVGLGGKVGPKGAFQKKRLEITSTVFAQLPPLLCIVNLGLSLTVS